MVWKCFRGRVAEVTLENGPYSAHHDAERAWPVIVALLASEENFLCPCGPFFRDIDMEPMQSLASLYITLPVTLVNSQSFLEPQVEPEH